MDVGSGDDEAGVMACGYERQLPAAIGRRSIDKGEWEMCKGGKGKKEKRGTEPTLKDDSASSSSADVAQDQKNDVIIQSTSCFRYPSAEEPKLLSWPFAPDEAAMVIGKKTLALSPKVRMNCMASFDAAILQVLASLSLCMLQWYEDRGINDAVEVQFGYDDRGLYAASNKAGISSNTVKEMYEKLKDIAPSQADAKAVGRAQYRLLEIIKFNKFKESNWHKHLMDIPNYKDSRKHIDAFLNCVVEGGRTLDAVLELEAGTTWGNGQGDLHAELRVLRAAWNQGSGKLYLAGAKRACWGCDRIINDLNRLSKEGGHKTFTVLRMTDMDAPGWAFPKAFCGIQEEGTEELSPPDPANLALSLKRRDSLILKELKEK